MTRLSLIVPVYNVEAYLPACLDSIIEQRFDDIEVIAVDDASTDSSAQILRDYGARVPGLRVISLERNGGLGNARNVGLAAARGRYVLFLDSDDVLTAGALRAIDRRLRQTRPDILVFNHARLFPDGRKRRNPRRDLLMPPAEGVTTLRERPDLLSLLMVAWNKAYRRKFLVKLGLQFPPGYYEDLPWTYPALMAAQRIALHKRVCYLYRQREEGSILRSNSRKHFDVFDQYDRVFAFFDAHPELQTWRPALHRRMVEHLTNILRKGDRRVEPSLHRQFFTGISKAHRRHRPATVEIDRATDVMLRLNAFWWWSWREKRNSQPASDDAG